MSEADSKRNTFTPRDITGWPMRQKRVRIPNTRLWRVLPEWERVPPDEVINRFVYPSAR